jgi:hypothetical protein
MQEQGNGVVILSNSANDESSTLKRLSSFGFPLSAVRICFNTSVCDSYFDSSAGLLPAAQNA